MCDRRADPGAAARHECSHIRVSLEILCDVRCRLGEGPRWRDGVLTWVDIEGRALHRWDGSHAVIELDAMVGCANPTEDGDVVLALADRIELLGTGEVLARFPHGPEVRANDGACDSDGRLWVGTLALDETPGAGALYRLERRGADADPRRAHDRERDRLVARRSTDVLRRHPDAPHRRIRLRRRARRARDVRGGRRVSRTA